VRRGYPCPASSVQSGPTPGSQHRAITDREREREREGERVKSPHGQFVSSQPISPAVGSMPQSGKGGAGGAEPTKR
jgi:hypothetical protein